MGSIAPTPQVGQRLLHVTIDEIARNDPDRAYASLPYDDNDLSKGYEDITYAVYANAINKLAWFIESCIGSSSNFETFTYIGKSDIRYQIMAMAAAKTQYRALFSSHLHSIEAHLNLMEKTNSQHLFVASGVDVSDILAGRPTPVFVIPELEELLSSTPAKHYPYDKPTHLAMKDDFIVLHSSGTTGLPKPITINHGCIACMDNITHASEGVDPVTGQKRRNLQNPGPNCRMFLPFLPFHGIAAFIMPPACVWYKVVYVPGFRQRPIKTSDVPSIIEHGRITDTFLSPAIIEDLVQHPDAPKYLSKLRTLFFGGAAMNASASAFCAKYTNLQNQWGITESGKGIDFETAPEDWAYNAFDLTLSGFRFEPIDASPADQPQSDTTSSTPPRTSLDSTHSVASAPAQQIHQLLITPSPTTLPYQALFTRLDPATTPPNGYPVGDLWLPHPNPQLAPFTFRFIGRVDDLISFKDGSNFHPTEYEMMHAEHALVRSAVLAGVGHREVVLVLELNEEALQEGQNHEALLERLWDESVRKVNERTPKNGRVRDLGHVVVTNFEVEGGVEGGMKRNAKGTVARKATLRKFEGVVEERYRRFGDHGIGLMERVK